MSGSYRRSADLAHLTQYLSAAASAQGEVEDIIVAKMGSKLSRMTEEEVRMDIESINTKLTTYFGNGTVTSEFEGRFGLRVSDVTFAAPTPSAEVQKVLSAKNEARILFEVMAEVAGYKGKLDQFYLDWPKLSVTQQTELRKTAMALSEQAKFEYNETKHIFDIQATPEIADALKNAGPGLAALLATLNPKSKKGT
jgi:hypothetical protein